MRPPRRQMALPEPVAVLLFVCISAAFCQAEGRLSILANVATPTPLCAHCSNWTPICPLPGKRGHQWARIMLHIGCHAGQVSCGEKIGVPKVALLFLARSGMPLSAVWEPWLRSVAGLVPLRVSCNLHVALGVPFQTPLLSSEASIASML